MRAGCWRLLAAPIIAGAVPGVQLGAQSPPASESAAALLTQGDSAWGLETSEGKARAEARWREALRGFRQDGDRRGEAVVVERLGLIQRDAQRPDSALLYFRQARALSHALGDSVEEANTDYHLASLFAAQGALDSAGAFAGSTVGLLEPSGPSPDLLRAYFTLADVQRMRGDADGSLRSARQAEAIARRLADTLGLANAGYRLGIVLAWQGQLDSAAAGYDGTAVLFVAAGDLADAAGSLTAAALSNVKAGHRDRASREMQRAIALRRQLRDTTDLTGGFAFVKRGLSGMVQRTPSSLAETAQLWRNALVLYDLGGDRKDYAVTLQLFADLYGIQGQLDSALAVLARALPIQLALLDSVGLAGTWDRLGRANRVRNPDSALVFLRRSEQFHRRRRDPAALAVTLEDIGETLGEMGRYQDAARPLAEAAELFLAEMDTTRALTNYQHAGNSAGMSGDPALALGFYRKAVGLARAKGDTALEGRMLLGLGALQVQTGAFDSAGTDFRRVVGLGHGLDDRDLEGQGWQMIGIAEATRGDQLAAIAGFRRSLLLFQATGDRRQEANTADRIGVAFYRRAELDSAVTWQRRALSLARAQGDSGLVATALNDLGTTFDQLRQPDSALAFLRQALVLHLASGDRKAAGSTLTNIGGVLGQKPGTRDSALSYYRRGLELQLATGDTANAGVTLGNIGLWFVPGEPDSALAYYRRALLFRTRAGDRAGRGVILSKVGQVLELAGEADSARKVYQAALADLRATSARENQVIVLADLAHLYHRNSKLRDLPTAVAYYDSAMALSADIASSAGGDAARVVYREQMVLAVEDWVLAWLARIPEVDPAVASRAALGVVERGRAQALLELMRGAPQGTVAGRDFGEQAMQVTKATAGPNTALVVYFVTQDTLLFWVTAPGAERGVVFRYPYPRDQLAALVSAYRSALGVGGSQVARRLSAREVPLEGVERSGTASLSPGTETADSVAALLGRLVFGPDFIKYLRGATELVIVPHGPLSLVPFGALMIPGDSVPLGARLGIRYAPSLTALAEREGKAGTAGNRPPRNGWRGMVVVGNPTMPTLAAGEGKAVALNPLPGAEAEGKWVADRLGVSVLSGPAAGEAAVRRLLPHAPLIHLATHGYAYGTEDRVRDSFVALAPGDGQDGLLTVGEILDDPALTLHAELVVLSACQTGLGDLKNAEGTVGLQRAFLARGARSVLVSLWSVSDAATALLMKQFYTHWLDDRDQPNKAEALRRAQADVRARPQFEEPRFWAAFQLVGAG